MIGSNALVLTGCELVHFQRTGVYDYLLVLQRLELSHLVFVLRPNDVG